MAFPYFHLAGFLSIIVNPIFTEASSPVLGPPLIPPSGSLLKEILEQQDLRAIYVVPSIAEQLLHEPGGLDLVKKLDFLCYTGGPFSSTAGKLLAEVTEVCPLYGSTEAFQVPQLSPSRDDWAYMEWNPCFKLEMQLYDDDAYELVLNVDASTESMSALNHNLPGIREWRTRDLFKPHPSKPHLWRYYGRRDDIVVLSNGEKFNPVPMELMIQGHPLLAGALVVGNGRSQASLLVEPKAPTLDPLSLVQDIWSLIEQANTLVPTQGRVLRSKILVASVDKPFIRAGKGTVVRKLTERSYQSEIETLYKEMRMPPALLTPRLKPSFMPEAVQDFVRNTVLTSLPSAEISNDDDLFQHGLDSVTVTEVCATLKAGVQEFSQATNLSWISSKTVYEHPTIQQLSEVFYRFLNLQIIPGDGNENSRKLRAKKMDALVQKYAEGILYGSPRTMVSSKTGTIIALTGSTGSVGTFLLESLLKDNQIQFIYCLNRRADAQKRQEQVLIDRGLLRDAFSSKLSI